MQNNIKLKSQLLILGDIHANILVIYDYINKLDLSCVSIIQVGDFGYNYTNSQLDSLNNFLKDRNINLLIVRGNHDCYYSHFPKLGKAEYDKKLSNIVFLKDFDVLRWEDKNILCIGGAITIDRNNRIVDESYWVQESINYSKINFTPEPNTFSEYLYNYYTKDIDIVISHTAPRLFHPYLKLPDLDYRYSNDTKLKSDLMTEGEFLDKMLESILPKKYFCGHFHQSLIFNIGDTDCRVLGINEMIEVTI